MGAQAKLMSIVHEHSVVALDQKGSVWVKAFTDSDGTDIELITVKGPSHAVIENQINELVRFFEGELR